MKYEPLLPAGDGSFPAVPEIADVDIAFGGSHQLLPPRDKIPGIFSKHLANDPFQQFFMNWYYKGLNDEILYGFKPKPGIDVNRVFRVFQSILGSYAPKHEHKMSGLAWMASWWLTYYGVDWSDGKDHANEVTKAVKKHYQKLKKSGSKP